MWTLDGPQAAAPLVAQDWVAQDLVADARVMVMGWVVAAAVDVAEAVALRAA